MQAGAADDWGAGVALPDVVLQRCSMMLGELADMFYRCSEVRDGIGVVAGALRHKRCEVDRSCMHVSWWEHNPVLFLSVAWEPVLMRPHVALGVMPLWLALACCRRCLWRSSLQRGTMPRAC